MLDQNVVDPLRFVNVSERQSAAVDDGNGGANVGHGTRN